MSEWRSFLLTGWKSWGVYVLALAAGLVSAWAVREHVQSRIQEIEADALVSMVSRVVAAYDLPAGTRLDSSFIAARDIPEQWAASGAFMPEAVDELNGAILVAPLKSGEPILAVHVTHKPVEPPLSLQLAPGRRAITIPVDEISALSGLLQPGDLIDLYVSFPHQQRQVTAPLLQGIRVLATGRRLHDHESVDGAYSTVTLDASPADAVKLVAARHAGSITAILRHRQDDTSNSLAVRGDLAALIGLEPGTKKRAPSITILYGDRLESEAPPGSSPIDGDDVVQSSEFMSLTKGNRLQAIKESTP